MEQDETHWFTRHPVDVLAAIGIPTERHRAEEFESLLDGDLSGYYYIGMASDGTDEALKWVMGAVAAHLNKHKLPFSAIHRVMPADYLRVFIEYLKGGKFDRGFAKDIFGYILARTSHHVGARRLMGAEILDEIIADPRFKVADSGEIDAIIESVIVANSGIAAKVTEQPQLIQWFVGQAMKAAKGAATGPVVLEKLKARFWPSVG